MALKSNRILLCPSFTWISSASNGNILFAFPGVYWLLLFDLRSSFSGIRAMNKSMFYCYIALFFVWWRFVGEV